MSILIFWRRKMSRDNKFNKESQDARRHDERNLVHPEHKLKKYGDKSKSSHHTKTSKK